jgi:hypothetical protein
VSDLNESSDRRSGDMGSFVEHFWKIERDLQKVKGGPMDHHLECMMNEIFSLGKRIEKLEKWKELEDEAYHNSH